MSVGEGRGSQIAKHQRFQWGGGRGGVWRGRGCPGRVRRNGHGQLAGGNLIQREKTSARLLNPKTTLGYTDRGPNTKEQSFEGIFNLILNVKFGVCGFS